MREVGYLQAERQRLLQAWQIYATFKFHARTHRTRARLLYFSLLILQFVITTISASWQLIPFSSPYGNSASTSPPPPPAFPPAAPAPSMTSSIFTIQTSPYTLLLALLPLLTGLIQALYSRLCAPHRLTPPPSTRHIAILSPHMTQHPPHTSPPVAHSFSQQPAQQVRRTRAGCTARTYRDLHVSHAHARLSPSQPPAAGYHEADSKGAEACTRRLCGFNSSVSSPLSHPQLPTFPPLASAPVPSLPGNDGVSGWRAQQ